MNPIPGTTKYAVPNNSSIVHALYQQGDLSGVYAFPPGAHIVLDIKKIRSLGF